MVHIESGGQDWPCEQLGNDVPNIALTQKWCELLYGWSRSLTQQAQNAASKANHLKNIWAVLKIISIVWSWIFLPAPI